MKLTSEERRRIRQIRADLEGWKSEGVDISTWQATFFLEVIDRLTGVKK